MTSPAPSTARARLVVFGVLLALLGGVLAVRTFGTSPAAATPVTQVPPSTTTTVPNRPIDIAERDVQAFVAKTRGLTFTRPVAVTLLDDTAFKARLLGHDQPDQAEVDKATGELRALGFVPPGFDLVKAVNDAQAADVVGFYDFKSKDLVVRGGNITPYVKEVMAHELTHALDDQHFGLDRPNLADSHDEQSDSFDALTEGDAVHVQLAYRDAMSPADKASADAEDASYGSSQDGAQGVAPALGDFATYPYAYGNLFVDEILKQKGQAALDAAFQNPPVSSAEILTPERYLAHMPGASEEISPPQPPQGKQIIDHGVIGQFGLFVMLRQTMGDTMAGFAAATWEGDSYIAWRDGAKTCVEARFLSESAPTAYPLAVLLKMWVDKQGGGTVDEPGTVLLTTCR